MWAALRVLALLLSAQAALGMGQLRLLGLRKESQNDGGTGLAVEPAGFNAANYGGRELSSAHPAIAILLIAGIPCGGGVNIDITVKITTSHTEEDVDMVLPVAPDSSTPGLGEGMVEVPLTEAELNDNHTDLSSDCVITFVIHGCISGDCDHFHEDSFDSEEAPDSIDVVPSPSPPVGGSPDNLVADPHMLGLRGQKIDWSGVNGGWYSLVHDSKDDLDVNVRLTAPLPAEFPDRQLVTGISIAAEGHSLTIEVKDPYTTRTNGCPQGVSPCLANGGLRAVVGGTEVDDLLRFSRAELVADDLIAVSATNLPVECRQFGGDKIWARMFDEMLQSRRLLAEESLEDWILSFPQMAAPDWCAKYIDENDLAHLQSNHAVFKIETPTVTVRLNAGINYQGDGERAADGRMLPDLDFWQMDVGLDGLDVENLQLSGILGETARPVYDEAGVAVMEGHEAFRGDVEDYRVSGPLGTHFAFVGKKQDGRE